MLHPSTVSHHERSDAYKKQLAAAVDAPARFPTASPPSSPLAALNLAQQPLSPLRQDELQLLPNPNRYASLFYGPGHAEGSTTHNRLQLTTDEPGAFAQSDDIDARDEEMGGDNGVGGDDTDNAPEGAEMALPVPTVSPQYLPPFAETGY